MRRLITQAYAKAKDILERYRDKLDEVSLRLVKEETLDGAAFDTMLGLVPVEPVPGMASPGIASLHLTDPNNPEA